MDNEFGKNSNVNSPVEKIDFMYKFSRYSTSKPYLYEDKKVHRLTDSLTVIIMRHFLNSDLLYLIQKGNLKPSEYLSNLRFECILSPTTRFYHSL